MAATAGAGRNPEFEALVQSIEHEVKEKGVSRTYVLEAAMRRLVHQWCTKRGWAHVAYHDDAQKSQESIKYFCAACGMWVSSQKTRTSYCCTDEHGSQLCGDWTVFCLAGDSQAGDEEDKHVVWNQDGHDDDEFKRRSHSKPNMIAVAPQIDRLTAEFKRANIPAGRAASWMHHRERKLA
jgi:hypothetical protein